MESGVEHPEVGDYYALLGLTPAASAREIRAAFRQLAKRLHPDVSRLPSGAERFRRVVEAYETLSDPVRRAAYDARYRPPAPAYTPAYAPAPKPVPPPERDAGASPVPRRTTSSVKRPVRPRGPLTPVTRVAPVGAVGTLSAGERASMAAEAIRAAGVRTRCVECGTLVSGDSDRCAVCLRKYGTFQEHLARAAARARRG
jgi:curved DNA-binding protein CbpA